MPDEDVRENDDQEGADEETVAHGGNVSMNEGEMDDDEDEEDEDDGDVA